MTLEPSELKMIEMIHDNTKATDDKVTTMSGKFDVLAADVRDLKTVSHDPANCPNKSAPVPPPTGHLTWLAGWLKVVVMIIAIGGALTSIILFVVG